MSSLLFQHLTFKHQDASEELFTDLTLHFSPGWTGIIGPNGSGKSTLLRLAGGLLPAESGTINRAGLAVYCPQRTDEPPEGLGHFLETEDGLVARIRHTLAIGFDRLDRWSSLSHGERKRAQIGVALSLQPEILLIDEPTNHLDEEARTVLVKALHAYSGTGLLVSHDRDLMESLCSSCLFLEPPTALWFRGSLSECLAQKHLEEDTAHRDREALKRQVARLAAESRRRQQEAQRSDARMSKRHLDKHDADGRGRINLARVTGRDAVAGNLARQIQGRLSRYQSQLADLPVKKQHEACFWLPAGFSRRDRLFALPAQTLGWGEHSGLRVPELIMGPRDRIALTGPNGSGKTTLLRAILAQVSLPADRILFIPQEIDLNATTRIMAGVRRLSPKERGTIFTIVSCLGTRPERLLENEEASPGEIRKILLALGIAREPHLVIMDEPTNHLDLTAITLLEQALAPCPCGLLLVSHDRQFLRALTTRRWHIQPVNGSFGLREEPWKP